MLESHGSVKQGERKEVVRLPTLAKELLNLLLTQLLLRPCYEMEHIHQFALSCS